MSRVFLFCWHQGDAEERAARLAAMGHEVTVHHDRIEGSNTPGVRSLTTAPPDAVLIDLGRLPSHGMAVAAWLRGRKATRGIPLVFVPGDEQKTAAVRARFPDATFAPWPRLRAALARAIAHPPVDPVVPAAPDYSGTPLWKKLGVKAGSRVAWIRAPRDFASTLGDLPEGVVAATTLRGERDVIVLFCKALAQLQADFEAAARLLAPRGGLWVAWPKKSAGVTTDLDQQRVRAVGLGHGLVDNKICAIDATWSGQRFARRKGPAKVTAR